MLTSSILLIEYVTESVQLQGQLDNQERETGYGPHLVPDKVLYLRNRSSGEHPGNKSPAVLRFEVFSLRQGRFVRVEGTIKTIMLVPFVLWIVYFIVYRRSCKVELRGNSAVDPNSPVRHRDASHLIRGDPYNVTCPASGLPSNEHPGRLGESPYF